MRDNSRINILDIGFDNITKCDAVEYALSLIEERKAHYVVTPNPEIVMLARKNDQLMAAVSRADLVIADGIGIIYGARILGKPLKERIPGIDFTLSLLDKISCEGKSVFLLGAKPGIAEKAANFINLKYPRLEIAGFNDGYFTDDDVIIEKINNSHADLLLVCLGAPKQEIWMSQNASHLDIGLMIGAGGSLDVFSGEVKRAPAAWRKLGIEWLYRLISDPKRIIRMTSLPKFIFTVILSRIRG